MRHFKFTQLKDYLIAVKEVLIVIKSIYEGIVFGIVICIRNWLFKH